MNEKQIAKERIEILFSESEKCLKKRPDLAKRYLFLAKKLAMKHNAGLSREKKTHLCKSCGSYLKFGHNATVRISRKGGTPRLIVCKECGKEKRLILSR